MSINSLLTNTPILNAIAASTQEILYPQTAQQVTGLTSIPNISSAGGLASTAITPVITFGAVPVGSLILVTFQAEFQTGGLVTTPGFINAFTHSTNAENASYAGGVDSPDIFMWVYAPSAPGYFALTGSCLFRTVVDPANPTSGFSVPTFVLNAYLSSLVVTGGMSSVANTCIINAILVH